MLLEQKASNLFNEAMRNNKKQSRDTPGHYCDTTDHCSCNIVRNRESVNKKIVFVICDLCRQTNKARSKHTNKQKCVNTLVTAKSPILKRAVVGRFSKNRRFSPQRN